MNKQKGSPRSRLDSAKRVAVEAGFTPILIVIILAALAGGYLLYQNFQNQSKPISPFQNTAITPQTPQSTTSPTAAATETDNNLRIISYIFKQNSQDENHYDIIIKLPQGSVIDNTNRTVILNGSKYRIGGENFVAGLCPWEDDGSGCTYDDNNSGIAKPLRIWRDNKGVFALNPQSIPLDGYFINNFKIFKESPDKIFTQEEINLWKRLLEKIEITPSKLLPNN